MRQYNIQGSGQYTSLASSLIGSGTYPFTASIWFYSWTPNNTGNVQVLYSFQDTTYTNLVVVYLYLGQLWVDYAVGGVAGTPVAVPGTLLPKFYGYNAVLVATSATDRWLYLGGIGVSDVIGVHDTNSVTLGGLNTSVLAAGLNSGTAFDFLSGVMDELTIWNVALSLNEVKQLCSRRQVFPPRFKSCTHYFKLGWGPNYSGVLDMDVLSLTALTNNGAVYDNGRVTAPWVLQRLKSVSRAYSIPSAGARGRPVVQVSG